MLYLRRIFQGCFFPLLVCCSAGLAAQYPLAKTYTTANGLPMNEIAYVAQDGLGYVWTTSTNGQLVRYDGRDFVNFTEAETGGIRFMQVVEPKYHDWVVAAQPPKTPNRRYAILRGDAFHALPARNLLGYGTDLRDSSLLVFNADSIFRVRTEPFRMEVVRALPELAYDTRPTVVTGLPDGSFFVFLETEAAEQLAYRSVGGGWQRANDRTNLRHRIFFPDGRSVVCRDNLADAWLEDDNLRPLRQVHWPSYEVDEVNNLTGFRVQDDQLFITLRSRISGRNDGYQLTVYATPITQPGEPRVHAVLPMPSFNAGHVCIASDGTLWQSGHAGLRRYWPHTEVYHSADEGMISSLHAVAEHTNGDIYLGGYGTGFTRIRDGVPERLTGGSWDPTIRVLPGSYRTAGGELLFINEVAQRTQLHVRRNGELRQYRIPSDRSHLTGFLYREVTLPDGAPLLNGAPGGRYLAMALTKGGVEDSDNCGRIGFTPLPYSPSNPWYIIGQERGIRLRNVLTLAQDRRSNIWFGHSSTGVGVYSPARDTAVTYLSENISDPGAVSMHIDDRDRLWLGSLRGLRYVDSISTLAPFSTGAPTTALIRPPPHPRTRQKMVSVRHIPSNYVPGLLQLGDTLIITHTGGVSFLDLNSPDLTHPRAVTIPTADYIGPSEQNALLLDRHGWLWLIGDMGAARLDFRRILRGRGSMGRVEIAVRGDRPGSSFVNQQAVRIPVGDRSLTYGYQLSVQDQLRDEVRTDLLLRNRNTGDTVLYSPGWRSSENLKVNYLEPGNYELSAVTFHDNQENGRYLTTIVIPKQLHEYWWFWPAVFLAITLPIALFASNRYVRTRTALARKTLENERNAARLEASELQSKSDRLQVSTLSNAVNPHFISNAITWLQSAYLVGRPIARMDEMADNLSQTIRTMFTNSTDGRASHPLPEELALVERYLRTVNIQYDERYQFDLPGEAARTQFAAYDVLLMQVQVHVENAIEHGLRYRRQARSVRITLEAAEDETLLIHVEDDGAGVEFVRARQARGDYRPGRGTYTMRLLQETFNRYNARPLRTTITSPIHTAEDGAGYGTRITIHVPNAYTYALESDRR